MNIAQRGTSRISQQTYFMQYQRTMPVPGWLDILQTAMKIIIKSILHGNYSGFLRSCAVYDVWSVLYAFVLWLRLPSNLKRAEVKLALAAEYRAAGMRGVVGHLRAWVLYETTDFDPELYLMLNPDVRAARVDPHMHYFSVGNREGREWGRRSTSIASSRPSI